jgi:hypothetical protein
MSEYVGSCGEHCCRYAYERILPISFTLVLSYSGILLREAICSIEACFHRKHDIQLTVQRIFRAYYMLPCKHVKFGKPPKLYASWRSAVSGLERH